MFTLTNTSKNSTLIQPVVVISPYHSEKDITALFYLLFVVRHPFSHICHSDKTWPITSNPQLWVTRHWWRRGDSNGRHLLVTLQQNLKYRKISHLASYQRQWLTTIPPPNPTPLVHYWLYLYFWPFLLVFVHLALLTTSLTGSRVGGHHGTLVYYAGNNSVNYAYSSPKD